MTTKMLTPADLAMFTGSEQFYRHSINRKVLYTEGARYVADAGSAYWLLDEIAFIQRHDARLAAEEFQVWKLTVCPDRTATLVCEDGNDKVIFSKSIPYTDFPLDAITLWFANDTIYLPGEH